MASLLKLSNNAIGRLSGNLAAGETTLSLQPGEGALFPAITGSEYFPVSIIRASDSAIEVVKVTARSTDTLTIERAQESTTALNFVAGDRVENRLTAKTVTDLETATATHNATSKATPVDADEIPLVDSAADFVLKKLTWANLKAGIFSAWGALINGGTSKATPVDADALALMDSAASNATKKLTLANLKAYIFSGGTLTGLLKFKSGANIASAATVDLTAATGNTVHITGTTAITAVTLTSGQVMDVIFDGVLTLTHHATNNNLPGAVNIVTEAGDRARYFYDGATVYCLSFQGANTAPLEFATAAEYAAGTDASKVLTPAVARAENLVSGTPVTASGTSVDFTAIPSWVKRITVMLSGLSTNGTSEYCVQIGDSGGVEATGYFGIVGSINTGGSGNATASTVGFPFSIPAAASDVFHGSMVLTKVSGNTWVASGNIVGDRGTDAVFMCSGNKALSDVLDRVRVTTLAGTNTFDAGTINIFYE